MDTTLDVRDLPDEQVQWLKRVIEGLRMQEKRAQRQSKDSTFAIHDSDVTGGEFKRKNAYE
jgi:ABC-type phosphate transport system auxiliary subunit